MTLDFSGRAGVLHVDFHRAGTLPGVGHAAKMRAAYDEALAALRSAYERGLSWVVFTHGRSTSGRGKISCRSVIRGLLRSPEATPYIVRSRIIANPAITAVPVGAG
jgi:hypothetical protein